MTPGLTVLTLGVRDFEASVRFYRDGLSFPPSLIHSGNSGDDPVAFFRLQGGLRLALWPQAALARDAGLEVSPLCPTTMSLGHNVGSRDEVDAVMALASQAGAVICKPAHETSWGGYAGYFQDPDGHLWEIVWNPHFEDL